jgi:hypothetical protein
MEDIIVAHLHDEASVDEVRDLFEWIRENPENAKEFVRYALLHAQLRGQLSGELRARKSAESATADRPTPNIAIESPAQSPGSKVARRERRSRFPYVLASALAASLLMVLMMVVFRKTDESIALLPPTQQPFATIAQTVDVAWGGERSFGKGDRTAANTLELREGFVRLELDSGVRVTLQGPARFELITPERAKLTSGLLTATVPLGAEGFRVDTPNAEVTDLGTAFGIHLDDNGISNVSVFDGEVDVALPDSTEKRLLKEGESARIGNGKVIESVDFDGTVFEKLWPVSSGIESSSGAFRFTPPWPRRIRFVRSDDDIFVVPEGYITRLTEPLTVNITTPGEYVHEKSLTPLELSSGQTVRSFLLHFHPEHDGDRRRFARTAGSIRFERPVLGLIVLHEELAASADVFPGRRAGESLEHRQLELTGNRIGDVIALSDDRQTVSLDLAAPTRFSDLVRVIVDASVEAAPTPTTATDGGPDRSTDLKHDSKPLDSNGE